MHNKVMRLNHIAKLCTWSLGIFCLCTTLAYAQISSLDKLSPVETLQQHISTQSNLLKELAKADVVYLGETHDRPEDHQVQLEILQALHQQNPKIAIAMEMFQRPYQGILDQYLAGKITEAQLVEQSDYNQRWGFPWEYYAPLLHFAKTHQLPVLALNTPTEVSRKVARSGLESLTADEQQYIPPISEIRTDNAQYRKMLQDSYQQHHQWGHGNTNDFEQFFTVQVLWDETMAETIAEFIKANPDYQVVVLAGQGHIVYGYGIPSRVARRLNPELVQRTVLLGASPESQGEGEGAIADYFWPHP